MRYYLSKEQMQENIRRNGYRKFLVKVSKEVRLYAQYPEEAIKTVEDMIKDGYIMEYEVTAHE